jgi:hypothetical protein
LTKFEIFVRILIYKGGKMRYLTIIIAVIVGISTGEASWRQFQKDSKNSGFTEIIPPNNPYLIWEKDLQTEIELTASPIVVIWPNAIEVVYISTKNGIYCLSSDSDIIWFYQTSPIKYTPVYEGNRLFVPVRNKILCLDPQTGEKIFEVNLASEIDGHLKAFNNNLYFVAGKRLYAFNLNGQLLWETSDLGSGFDNQAPAIDDQGNIYVVSLGDPLFWYDFRFYKFTPNGNQVFMKQELYFESGGVRMSPTISQKAYFGTVYSFGWSSSLYCYDLFGNQIFRKTDEIGLTHVSPAISLNNNMIIYGVNNGDEAFIKRSDTNGNISWSYPTKIKYSSPAILGNNWIVYGTEDGFFKILNQGGNLVYEYFCNAPLTSPAIGFDNGTGAIYIASSNGKVFKFGANPVTVKEKLIFSQIKIEKEIVKVFDVSGKEVFSGFGKTFKIKNLPNGIYFIKLKDSKIKIFKL